MLHTSKLGLLQNAYKRDCQLCIVTYSKNGVFWGLVFSLVNLLLSVLGISLFLPLHFDIQSFPFQSPYLNSFDNEYHECCKAFQMRKVTETTRKDGFPPEFLSRCWQIDNGITLHSSISHSISSWKLAAIVWAHSNEGVFKYLTCRLQVLSGQ